VKDRTRKAPSGLMARFNLGGPAPRRKIDQSKKAVEARRKAAAENAARSDAEIAARNGWTVEELNAHRATKAIERAANKRR
jgi:hypothetical protein